MRLYRASEIGGCTKAIIAKQLGYEPLPTKDELQTVFHEGDLHETDVVDQLNQEGTVYDQQLEVNLEVGGALLQGHIDGKFVYDLNPQASGHKLLEIKSVSQAVWDDFASRRWDAGLFPKYKWQLSVYMIATGMEAIVAIKNRNTGRIHREGVEVPFYSLDQIRERIQGIEEWVNKGLLPGPCDTPSFPCPFYYLHEDKTELEHDEVLDALGVEYEQLMQRKNNIQDRISTCRNEINKAMGTRRLVETGKVRVTIYDVKSTRVDTGQMQLDGVDVEKYTTRSQSERMRITIKDDAESAPEVSP